VFFTMKSMEKKIKSMKGKKNFKNGIGVLLNPVYHLCRLFLFC